jgi:two-component system response regulator FlrC
MLASYSWPGNVRELENVVQRAVVLCSGRVITPAHVMFDDAGLDDQVGYSNQLERFVQSMPVTTPHQAPSIAPIEIRPSEAPANLEQAVMVSEQQVIMAAIQSTDSRMEAAAKLGISPRTLRYKLAQLRSRGVHQGVAA